MFAEKPVMLDGRVVGKATNRAYAYFRALATRPGRERRVAILETERAYYCRIVETPRLREAAPSRTAGEA
ncbi:MAG TPA: hypothetical protein VEH84_02420 [Alphaproteobacteria bacterium]|nr:hypothetical protein [Alphaproteobacteria bacterium]